VQVFVQAQIMEPVRFHLRRHRIHPRRKPL
jgi:hypothetical protein